MHFEDFIEKKQTTTKKTNKKKPGYSLLFFSRANERKNFGE